MNAEKEFDRIKRAAAYIKEKTNGFKPCVAAVLGSGLGAFASTKDVFIEYTIPYRDIPEYPVSTVSGHAGRMLFGYVKNVPVVIMQGRTHMYEGYTVQDVVLPVRTAAVLGAKVCVLTNSSGGINRDLNKGDLMLILDHISSFVPSPLRGENIEKLGIRFPDMSDLYNKDLRDMIKTAAMKAGIKLKEGVYLQTPGPQYETPAEIRMMRTLGADAVGMSTACEAIAAHHAGMIICGISCITNAAAGMSGTPLSHDEVKKSADSAEKIFCKLMTETIFAAMNYLQKYI